MTYFWANGRMATSGYYMSHLAFPFQVFAEVEELMNARRLPGLVYPSNVYLVMAEVPGYNTKQLFIPKDIACPYCND